MSDKRTKSALTSMNVHLGKFSNFALDFPLVSTAKDFIG